MHIFISGRLCLFGEHSDWAGTYRTLNPALKPGYALVVGTNQGLYADVKPHPHDLIFQPSLNHDHRLPPLILPMQPSFLLDEARQGGFASYLAGTAYQVATRYPVLGLEVDNYLTDLPIQKGLSSSAALCLLIVRAFNRLYRLKLSVREEMELAYLGERTTPSQCGRMDQACAFGSQPILMTFDGDQVAIEELTVQKPFYFLIVDLGGTKVTTQILSDLHRCYPVAHNQIQHNVQHYLGAINAQFIQQAVAALQQGNAPLIGSLMLQAQAQFDRYLIPASPIQLAAPKLHSLLTHPALQPFIYGGKGVGSQGDGTAQLIAQDQMSQQKAASIILRDFPQMQVFKLTLTPQLT